jgi:ribonuclease HII
MILGVVKLVESHLNFRLNEIVGIDEAGRGCLAGDVFAAAVILNPDKPITGLDDSKKLTAIRRERLYDEITENCIDYSVATASVAEIEEINILQAALLAMKRAYEKLTAVHELVLVDGNQPPAIFGCECVVKGDAKYESIAAASILAKVSRDRYMEELAKAYPQYQFEKHKGYATKLHKELILRYGALEIHRKLFIRKLKVN